MDSLNENQEVAAPTSDHVELMEFWNVDQDVEVPVGDHIEFIEG